MSQPRQGEVRWAEAEDRRRPVPVVTRSDAISVLTEELPYLHALYCLSALRLAELAGLNLLGRKVQVTGDLLTARRPPDRGRDGGRPRPAHRFGWNDPNLYAADCPRPVCATLTLSSVGSDQLYSDRCRSA